MPGEGESGAGTSHIIGAGALTCRPNPREVAARQTAPVGRDKPCLYRLSCGTD